MNQCLQMFTHILQGPRKQKHKILGIHRKYSVTGPLSQNFFWPLSVVETFGDVWRHCAIQPSKVARTVSLQRRSHIVSPSPSKLKYGTSSPGMPPRLSRHTHSAVSWKKVRKFW